ncbi:MAG: DUF4838 domain-containing protein [Candidatus Hydrogenedentes bacterium]|nr:DUF4838 domain-containing protein [Candidatus Hydrogenedentota bacterium]
MTMRLFIAVALSLAAATAFAGENLYPDPGFEKSGVQCDAHSGERAAHLEVGPKQHWVATGGPFAVEPYATYRATAWAKARITQGTVSPLYVYQWDSYIWAFVSQARAPSGPDWQELSITFRAPFDHVFLHPLSIFDAADTEAWLDDIVVEKVMSPEETIAALEALDAVRGDDARLLARWYVEHSAFDKADRVLQGAQDPRVKADIACVIAKGTEDPGLMRRMFVEMLRFGAPGMHAGNQRLWEVASALEPANPFAGAAACLPGHGADQAVLSNFAAFAAASGRGGDAAIPRSVAARRAELAQFKDVVDALRAELGDGADGNAAFKSLDDAAIEWAAALAEESANMGNCTIMIGGKPLAAATHAIVVAQEPTPQEQTAARDLQMHLERMTGQEIPLLADTECEGKCCLSVGKNERTTAMAANIDYDALGLEGIRILTTGPDIVLTGNKRGVLYAVYVFLEEHLGCRWFTPDCATWPTTGTINVGGLDIAYVPPFENRDTDYPNSRPPVFGVRNRLNGSYSQATEEWGGKVSYRGFVHTFNGLVPPEQYFAEHPEYYSEIGGQRVAERAQLCLTNPDVLRIATDTVLRWIEESPDASIISVSQNDCHNYCTCPNCAALAEKEGSESGPLLHFVNAIADVVAEKHPDIIIDTLAYQYTRKPPKHVRPRPNVAIRLCSIECEFNRPLATSPFNESFVDDIVGWNAISDRLHIWDYVINYGHCVQPFPNLRVLQPNIQFFRDHGVTGIYEEANYFSKGGELAELRTYVIAKLLWDPDYDVGKAIEEFGHAYYGASWPPIRDYIDDIHRLAVSDPAFHMGIGAPPTAPFQSAEAVERYVALFDKAEAAAQNDPVVLHRVQVARLPLLYTQIMRCSSPAFTLGDDALVPVGSQGDPTELVARFVEIARKEGLTRIAESSARGPLDAWVGTVGQKAEPVPVIRLRSNAVEAVVAPALGGRLVSVKHNGTETLNVVQVAGGIDPKTGGYKEFSEIGYRSPGWIEPYAVVEQGERFVVVEGTFSNGLKIRRRYEVPAEGAVLRIASTLTNASGATKSTCMRVHPCFHLEDAASAVLRFGGQDISLAEGAMREKELTYRGDGRPDGEWAVVDPAAKRMLVSRFDPEQVGVCYFDWNGPQHRVNPELWSVTRQLEPGQTITIEHEYEFRAL